MSVGTPPSGDLSVIGGTLLSNCDGLTYTQLLDHGYGLTPITPSNSQESTPITPSRSQSVKRRLVLEDGNLDEGEFRTPVKTPRRSRQKSVSASSSYIPSPSRASPGKPSRYDTSLGKLTKEFVELFQTSPDGIVNLNQASENLNVQKRRIYDITNVLEGVGLVRKKSKNNVQWVVSDNGSDDLNKELISLRSEEAQLDSLIKKSESHLLNLSQDKRFAYITYHDLHSIAYFKHKTVFAIKAPPNTRLQVPNNVIKEGYKIYLKSEDGPIEVFLSESRARESPTRSLDNRGHDLPLPVTPKRKDIKTEPITPKNTCSPSLPVIKTEVDSSVESPSKVITSSPLDDDFLASAFSREDSGGIGSSRVKKQPQCATFDEKEFVDMVGFGYSQSPPPFLNLEAPISDDDYTFALGQSEGLSDLFDFSF